MDILRKLNLLLVQNKEGKAFIGMSITLILFVMMVVSIVNISGMYVVHQEADVICDNILEAATASGRFGTEVDQTVATMKSEHFDFHVEFTASKYHSGKAVQLGDRMTVTVTVHTQLQLFGNIRTPMTIVVTKSGLSERYWK